MPVAGGREAPRTARGPAVAGTGSCFAGISRLTCWVEVAKRDLAVPPAPREMGIACMYTYALASAFTLAHRDQLAGERRVAVDASGEHGCLPRCQRVEQ